MSAGIEGIVRESARKQVTIHRVTGGIWGFLGAIFVVTSIFVPGKDDEAAVRVGAGIGGAVLILASIGFIQFMTARIAMLVELLLSRRSELKGAGIVAMRSRGIVIAHAITVSDASNRRYRMRVPSEADARAILANIPGEPRK